MLRRLYTLLAYLAAPIVVLRLLWRSRKLPDYRRRIGERFGFAGAHPPLSHCIWVHAVSIGEINAAAPLIRKLLQHSELPVVVTNVTPTGATRTRQLFGDRVVQRMACYDLPGSIRRFLRHTKPRALIILETELWPNLHHVVANSNIPIAVVNARLSDRSFHAYQRLRPLAAETLRHLGLLAAQTQIDAERFLQLGTPVGVVKVCGNLKYDLETAPGAQRAGRDMRSRWGAQRPVLIAASTHQPEEEILIQACRLLWPRYPNLLLILAPRHPERFDPVYAQCRKAGLEPQRSSNTQRVEEACRCLLVDRIGVLPQLFHAADVAFVGGSLIRHGGQNVLEACAAEIPIITGPHCFHFSEITAELAAVGALQFVHDAAEIAACADLWLKDSQLRQQAGSAALALIAHNRGAIDQVWALLCPLLEQHLA